MAMPSIKRNRTLEKKNYWEDTTNEKWQGLDCLQRKMKSYQETFVVLQKTDIYFMNMSNNFYKTMMGNIEQVKQLYPAMTSGFMSRVSGYVDEKLVDEINQHQAELEKLEQHCFAQWNLRCKGSPINKL